MDSETRYIVEVTGYIKKKEKLVPVGDNIVQNTCVLESLYPFPGYYGNNFPDKSQPRSIFFVLGESYTFEEIGRKTKNIKKRFKHDFNASDGKIIITPYENECIRIKYLRSFNFLPELQREYIKENVRFHKEKEFNKEAIIKINKVFQVFEEDEGIYRDAEDDFKCYLEVPEKLEWEKFASITADIKNNLVNNRFDAAQGVFFRSNEIVDVIRIFDQEKEIQKMRKLRNMYLEEIRRIYK
jgi:hypothetical protein